MTIELPNLDDRTFAQLVTDARHRIQASCPAWTDLSVHDPGVTLLEAFAFLTEVLIYRVNRLPDKAFVAFLNLLGVQRRPPVAAGAVLRFSRDTADDRLTLPVRTEVTISGGAKDDPVFITDEALTLEPGTTTATVTAHHCRFVDGELVGEGTGVGGQVVEVAHPPMVTTTETADVLVGVEVEPGELPEGATAREWEGRVFRIWEPTWRFTTHARDETVYVLNMAEGRISFAPASDGPGSLPVAAVPPAGREIRVWYRTGGGLHGNVAAGILTTVRPPVREVSVTNPEPAHGGRDLEPVDDMLVRGPREFLTMRRAVTASDFELLAEGTGGVARAKALTRADVWSFANPGEVEVVLVADVPGDETRRGRITPAALAEHQTAEALRGAEHELELRRTLGTRCVVGWAGYKPVTVHARVVVRREEDAARVHERILDRLHRTISPLRDDGGRGWPFGRSLRRSNVYRMLEQAEPGVQWVDEMSFVLDEAPDGEILAVAADGYQRQAWFAGCGPLLFRSTNDGDGWERVGRFDGEQVRVVAPYPAPARPGITPHPGLVAVVTRTDGGARVHVSEDLGGIWRTVGGLDIGVTDIAWTSRGALPELLLSTDAGLYEVPLLTGATPVPVTVDPADPDRGFYAVESFVDERGGWCVAVASQAEQGVYISTTAGQTGSFEFVGLQGDDTRTLAVLYAGPATWLWAGFGEPDPASPGSGAARARLFEADVVWERVGEGWVGGTCWSLAFSGRLAIAGTQNGGVLELDTAVDGAAWQPLDVNAGLPLRDRFRFEPVTTVGARPAGAPVEGATDGWPLIVGGPKGVHRNRGQARRKWEPCDHRRAEETVTIPETWVICSGDHQIRVVTSSQAEAAAARPEGRDGSAAAPPAPGTGRAGAGDAT